MPVLKEGRYLTKRRRSKRGRKPKKEWDESPASSKIFGDGPTPASRANMALLAELTMKEAGHSRDPLATYAIAFKDGSVERNYGKGSS